MPNKSFSIRNDVMGADYFAPGEVTPISQKAYITKAPVGYYEVGGSLGFNVNAPDFTPAALVTWVQTNMPALSTWLNNISGGDWGAHKMGTLHIPLLDYPVYPYQVAPIGNLTAAQVAYNNAAIQTAYNVFAAPYPPVSFGQKDLSLFFGVSVQKGGAVTNFLALANAAVMYTLSEMGYSLNPADGFISGLSLGWIQLSSPSAYSALASQIQAIETQEQSVLAKLSGGLPGFSKFLAIAGAAVAAVVTAGAASPALTATLKNAGGIATAIGNNPALSGTSTGQTLSGIGSALNPTPLQKFQLWATANPGDAEIIYALLGLLVIFIVYKIAKR